MPDTRIEEAYRLHQSGKTPKEIGELLGVSASTVRSWKSRYKWGDKDPPKKVQRNATQRRKNATQRGTATKKKNTIPNNARPGNHHAVTHGLFQKHLPPEALEIAEGMINRSPIDMIWDQILISYAAILRAQKIMYVESSDDLSSVLTTQGKKSYTYTIRFAQDKQATFLQAQAKAQSQFQSLIRQYEKMCREDPLATQEQQARIELLGLQSRKIKADITRAEGDDAELSKLDRLLEGLDDQSNG